MQTCIWPTVSCFSKIQIGFTFLVPAHPGSPGKRAVKRVCVCVRACVYFCKCFVHMPDVSVFVPFAVLLVMLVTLRAIQKHTQL